MILHKNNPTFELITSKEDLISQLKNIENAGRTCYQSYKNPITESTARTFIKMIIQRGHLSVIEHSLMTVKFFHVSRGFTHELVRHRLASYSQESTRYVDYAKDCDELDLDKFSVNIISPPHRNENEKVKINDKENLTFVEMCENIEKYYRALRKAGWTPEDARQILPNGLKADIVISANFREWRHIFEMRTSKFAHWEIRNAMIKLLEFVKPILSPIYDDFKIVGKDQNNLDYCELIKN